MSIETVASNGLANLLNVTTPGVNVTTLGVNITTLGIVSTVLVTITFFGVCLWAFSPGLKQRFDEDAKLPFADDANFFEKSDNEPKDHQR